MQPGTGKLCIGFGYQLNVYSICTEHA